MVQPPGSLETGVPRLSDVALDYLARNITCIKSLSDVPDTLVLSLFQVCAQQEKEMAPTRLFVVGGGGMWTLEALGAWLGVGPCMAGGRALTGDHPPPPPIPGF